MHQLLSYYPTHGLLDEILSHGKYDQLNIFIDLKNNLQTTYMEHAIVNIIESTQKSRHFDTSVFSSLISFLSFHRKYALNRNIKLNFFIFFETGRSSYHTNISKKYKISRRIDNLYGLDNDKRELFFDVLQRNFRLIELAGNKIPNTKVIRLKNLEADFIPYYLLSRKIVDTSPNIAQLIYSNDHDLLQCLVNDNTFVYQKIMSKVKRIVKQGQVLERELKRPNNIPDEYHPLALSIIGDPGDDVTGVKGIGPASFIKCFPYIQKMIGSMEELYKNVMENKQIFDVSRLSIPNKNTQKIIKAEEDDNTISNNLKLVSFELISRALEEPKSVDMIEKRKDISRIIKNNELAKLEALHESLTKVGVELEYKALDLLYHNSG